MGPSHSTGMGQSYESGKPFHLWKLQPDVSIRLINLMLNNLDAQTVRTYNDCRACDNLSLISNRLLDPSLGLNGDGLAGLNSRVVALGSVQGAGMGMPYQSTHAAI